MNWKDPPADPSKNWINKSLELQANLTCNWTCISCDQFSQFPMFSFIKRGSMTMHQIDHFAREMIENNAYIGRIRIVGGEPTVNKMFGEIVRTLHEALVPEHIGFIEVVTNGTHPEIILPVREFLNKVRVSGEAAKQKSHTASLVHSPASLGYQGIICKAPWHCGISLNHWGFFPCSSGAGLARFHNWMFWAKLNLPLSKELGNATAVWDNWPDLQDLCNHCCYALKPEDKIKSGTSDWSKNTPSPENQKLIDEWKSGFARDWPVYGQPAAVA
jgi:hypothetical protein